MAIPILKNGKLKVTISLGAVVVAIFLGWLAHERSIAEAKSETQTLRAHVHDMRREFTDLKDDLRTIQEDIKVILSRIPPRGQESS